MLFDPKWGARVPAKSGSLEDLIAWLETQSPNGEYDFDDCEGGCLAGLYAISRGLDWYKVHDEWFGNEILGDVACETPWTFGCALDRARAALTARMRT